MISRDHLVEISIAFLGLIGIPWTVFITLSIFSLRQQVALLKQEIGLLERIHKLVEHNFGIKV